MSSRNPTDMGGAFAGVPLCSRERCPSYDGKRCGETGNEPGDVCVPEVRAMAARLVDADRILGMMAKAGIGVRYFCSMCNADFADEAAVRAHQAECAEHPAVKERDKLRMLLEEALDLVDDAIDATISTFHAADERIRKEAGL